MPKRILGIESSCDETAAAVVEDGSRILSSIVASQMSTHTRYGGVVPELASREHLRAIVPAVRLALDESGTALEDLAAIAVTQGPGLVGSLLVGITYAKAIAFARGLPLIAVNHIEGHIHAVVSQNKSGQLDGTTGPARTGPRASSSPARTGPARPSELTGTPGVSPERGSVVRASSSPARTGPARPSELTGTPGVSPERGSVVRASSSNDGLELPALALVVSGGHTHLYEVRHDDDVRQGSGRGFLYRLLGKTRDDAAGEAFDKVGKLLGFGYPGGPVIDSLAPFGDPHGVRFTLAKMKGNTLDFSFSGIKTAVLRWVESHDMGGEIAARRAVLAENHHPSVEEWIRVTPQRTLDLIASFQYTVIEELLRRAIRSADEIGARSLIVSGGVACNSGLRAKAASSRLPYPVFFPTPGLSTDNAAMIAAAAFVKLERGEFADFGLRAQANLALA